MSSLDRLSDFLVQLDKNNEQDAAAAAPVPDAAPESALDTLANFAAQLDLQSAPGAAPGSAPGEQDLTAAAAKMYENEVVLPESVGFIPREIERGARGQVSQAAQAIATPGMRAQLIQSIYNGAWTLAELASAGMGPAMRELRIQSPELKQAITGEAAQETSMAIERAAFDTPMDPTRVREELIAAQGAAQGTAKGQREGIVADVARATGQSLTQFAAMAPAVALGTPVAGAAMASQMYLPGSAWTAGALEYIDQTNRDRATAAMEGRDIPEFTLSGMRDYAATSALINTGVELGGAALGGKIIGKIAKTTGATAVGQAALKPLIDRGMPIVDRVMVSKVGSKGLQTFARLSENTLEFRNGFFGKALAMGATSGLEESGEELVTAALMSPFTSAPLSEDIANGLYSAMIGLGAGGVGGVAPAGAFAVRQGVVNVRDSMRPETDRERVLRQIHTDAMQRKTNWSQDLSEEQNARLSTALDSVNGMDQEQRGTFLRELGDRRVDARTNADNLLTQRQQLDIGLTGALDLAENGTDEEKAAAKDQAEQIRGQIATIDEQLQLATSDAMMADAQYSAVAEKIGEMPATIDQAAPEQVLTDVSTRAGVELKPTAMPKNGARAQKQIEALGRKVVWFRPSKGTFSPAFHSMRSKGVVYMNADAAPANVLANALEEVFHDIQMFQPELAQVFMDKAGLMPVYQAGVAYAAQGTKESEDKARMDRAALAQAESAVAQLEGEQASISPEAARMGAARIEQEGTANAFAAAARATGSGSILAPLQQFAARRGLLGRDVMAAMAVLDAASRAAAVETVEGTKPVATLSPLARTLLWANDMNLDFKGELDAAESYARGETESMARQQTTTGPIEAAKVLVDKAGREAMRDQERFFKSVWPTLLAQTKRQLKLSPQNFRLAAKRAIADLEVFLRDNPKFADYYNKDWGVTRSILSDYLNRPMTDDEFVLFRLLSGLNSPNTKLPSNQRDAVNMTLWWINNGNFDAFKLGPKPKTGTLIVTEAPIQISGTTANIKLRSMKAIELLVKQRGSVVSASNYLQEMVTPKELNAFKREMGYKGIVANIGNIKSLVQQATGQDLLIPRMFIFGQKVGAYTLNAIGDGRFTTVDIWESRHIRSYFTGMFEKNTGLPVTTSEHDVFTRFNEVFREEFEKETGQTWQPSALQAVRWFYIIDAAKRAGYTAASTNETISFYTERTLRSAYGYGGTSPQSGRQGTPASRGRSAAGKSAASTAGTARGVGVLSGATESMARTPDTDTAIKRVEQELIADEKTKATKSITGIVEFARDRGYDMLSFNRLPDESIMERVKSGELKFVGAGPNMVQEPTYLIHNTDEDQMDPYGRRRTTGMNSGLSLTNLKQRIGSFGGRQIPFYVVASNPLFIDGKKSHWSRIPVEVLPKDFADFFYIETGRPRDGQATADEIGRQALKFGYDVIELNDIDDDGGLHNEIIVTGRDNLISPATGFTLEQMDVDLWRNQDGIPPYSSLTKIKDLGGSTGAALFEDPDGGRWVVKANATQDHLKNEWLAFQLYNDLGITDLPKNGLDAAPTKSRAKAWDKTLTNADYLRQLMLTKLVKGPTLGEYMADDEISDDDKNQVREILASQMMVDAVMRNWDVIGADADNIVVKDNRPFRVDLGGTLNFRAQGAKKDKLTIRGVQETLYRLSDYSQGMFALANPESLAKQLLSMLEEDGAVLEQNSTASAFRESRDLHIQVVFGVDRTRATSLVREYEIESRLVEFGAQRLDKILRGEVIPSDAYAREYWNIPFDNKSGSKQLEMAETIDDLRAIQFDTPSTANDLTDSNLKLAKLLRTALDSESRLELLKITEMEPDYGWKYVDIARKAITILDRIAGETDDGQKLKETVREALASYNEAIANKRNSIRDEVSKSDEIAAIKQNTKFQSSIEGFIDSITMARVVSGEWMQSPEIVAAERVLSKAQKSLADFLRSSPTERARLAEVSYARPDEDAEVTALRQQIEDLKRQMRDVQNTTAAQRVNALREVRVLERKLSAAQLIAEQKIGQAARVSARLEIQKQVNRDAKQAAEETAAKMSTDLESARATVASLRQQLREAKSNADTEDLLREAEKKLDRVANWSYAIGRNEGLVAGQVAGMQQERREQLRVIKPLKERLPLVEARLAKATEDLRAARKQIAQDEKSAQKAVDFAYQLGMRSGQVQGMMRGRQVLLRKMAQREDTLQRQLTGLRDLMTTKVTNLEALRTAISQIATDAARTLPVRLRGPLAIRIANAKTIGQANRIAVEATKLAINEEVSSTLKTIARLKKQMNKRGMKYDTRVQIETLLRDADAALRQANRRRIQASVGVMKNAAGRSMGAAIINAVNVYSQVADAAAKVDAALVLYTNDAAAFKAEKQARVAKYQADTAALVANMQGRPTLPMRDRTDQPPRTSLARRIRVANSDIYTLQLELEGKSDGVINKLLTAAQQGKGASALEHAAIIRQLEPLLQAAGYSGLDDYALKNGMMGQTLVNPVTVTLGGSNVTIPVGTMLSIAAMDDETLAIFPKAGEPLTQGIRFPGSRTTTTIYPTREEIVALKAGLTPGQQGLVDGMKAILETQIRDRTMDAIWKIEGDQPPIVQNYWPRIRDMAGFEGESAAVLNAAGALVRGALTSVGFANARTGGNRPLLYSDAFQTWDRHVQVALDMIHMAQPYRDAATVLSDQQVVSLMDKQMGPGTANAVLSIFSNGVGATARTNATIIDKLTNNVTGAVLSLSPRTWAKVQLGGVIRLASEVGPVYLAEGTARATAMLRSPAMWQARVEQIHSQSGYFTHRHQMNMRSIMSGSMSEQDRIKVMTAAKAVYKSIAAATTTTRAANFTDTLNALGDTTDNANIVLSSLVDVLRGIDENIMLTAVEARLAEAKDEGYVGAAAFAVAVERAEQDFRKSQNSSDEFDETAFAAETRTSNKSPAWRLLFPFSSDTLKARNQIRRAWISGERRAGTALAIGGNLTTNAIINAASVMTLLYIAKTISSALGGADEPTDEEDKAFDKAVKELPVTVAAELSGQVGGYVGLALQGMITATMYRRAPMQALITRPLEQATREAAKIGGEDGSWAYLAPAILAAAQLRGVPIYQLYSFVAKQIPEAEKTPQEKLQKRLQTIEQRFSPEEIRKRVLQRAKNAGRVSIPLP